MADKFVDNKWGLSEFAQNFLFEKTILSQANPRNFPEPYTLQNIVQQNCRVRKFKRGEILMSKGHLATSIYFIKSGNFTILLEGSDDNFLVGEEETASVKIIHQISNAFMVKNYAQEMRSEADTKHIFHHFNNEVNAKMSSFDLIMIDDAIIKIPCKVGQMLGEIAAMTRSVRSASVVATDDAEVIEMRWQGLRQILLRDQVINQQIVESYKVNVLNNTLKNFELFENVPEHLLASITKQAQFQRHGMQDDITKQDTKDEIVLFDKGDKLDGIMIVISGNGRIFIPREIGTETINYLIKDDIFGIKDLIEYWESSSEEPPIFNVSVSSIGALDAIFIPLSALELAKKEIISNYRRKEIAQKSENNYDPGVNFFFHI